MEKGCVEDIPGSVPCIGAYVYVYVGTLPTYVCAMAMWQYDSGDCAEKHLHEKNTRTENFKKKRHDHESS